VSENALPGLDDRTPPAGPWIKDLLESALISHDRMELPELEATRACKTNAEVEALHDAWYHHTYAFLMHSALAHVFIRLEENHPNLAAGLAAEVKDWIESGDAYPEWIWEWASERGLDPDEVIASARRGREEWLHTVPKHLQTGVELDIPA
jgi:hypothetical protein